MNDLRKQVDALARDPEFDGFAFHLVGIVEAQEFLASLVVEFQSVYKTQPRRTEEVLGQIEVEVYMHLKHHMDRLREPFEAAKRRFFGPDSKIIVDDDG